MNVFEAIVQGVVQGLTEFLPVSSSGHLLLSQHILGISENNLFFDVMLHLGTLIAVLVFYRHTIRELIIAFFEMIPDIVKGKFNLRKLRGNKNIVMMIIIGLLPLLILFFPVGGDAKNVKGIAEMLSNSDNIIIPGVFLIITSILLHIGVRQEKRNVRLPEVSVKSDFKSLGKTKKIRIKISDALAVGFAQCLAAVFPGLSRSGSTLSVGLMRNMNKKTALDYSFILGIPAIMAAAVVELKEAFEMGIVYDVSIMNIVFGIVVSAVVGFIAIKLFKWVLDSDKMKIFIVYTAVLGSLAVVAGVIEQLKGANLFTGRPL